MGTILQLLTSLVSVDDIGNHIYKLSMINKIDSELITRLMDSISWGASASTLRMSALAVCYSVAEYCCRVWAGSSYTNLIDTQLHSSMRLISGYLHTMHLLLYAIQWQLTTCSKSWKPTQIGPCMLMSLSIHLHGLHPDDQYGQTQLCSRERTGRWLLWSTTLL